MSDRIDLPKLLWQLSWIWLVGAAYLYQWKYARRSLDVGLTEESQG